MDTSAFAFAAGLEESSCQSQSPHFIQDKNIITYASVCITYRSGCGGPRNGIRAGLCQAMKAKTKTRTHPALTESVNSGLRPPMAGSMTIAVQVQKRLRMPKERRRVVTTVWIGDRGLRHCEQDRGLAYFKGSQQSSALAGGQPDEIALGKH